jgi:hypothetical protein
MRVCSLILSMILFFNISAEAKDLCTVFRNTTPLPDWYNTLCNGNGGGFDGLKSVVGGAYSTFADAFSLNPASLPTVSLPLGAEMVASAPTGVGIGIPRITFNTIKGFSGVGAGIGTDSNNSIFSNRANYRNSSSSSFIPAPALPSISFASAFSLEKLFTSGGSVRSWIPKLGTVFRYNRDLSNWSPGLGLATNLGPFSLGLSAIFEQAANFYPKTTVLTQSIGIHILKFQADYTLISNIQAYGSSSTVSLFALSGNLGGFTLNGAARLDADYTNGGTSATYHAGLQYVFSTHFALAYLYNYIPGFQSITVQVMF